MIGLYTVQNNLGSVHLYSILYLLHPITCVQYFANFYSYKPILGLYKVRILTTKSDSVHLYSILYLFVHNNPDISGFPARIKSKPQGPREAPQNFQKKQEY